MSWLPNIRYGTEGYPEKVPRRLRGFNIAVWVAALIPAGMAIVRFIDGKWKVGAADVLVATTYASMPRAWNLPAFPAGFRFRAKPTSV